MRKCGFIDVALLVLAGVVLYWGVIATIVFVGFKAGPAHPAQDGKAYLEKNGYSQEVIQTVLDFKELSPVMLEKLARESSPDVRFLVAQNPFISQELLDRLVKDKSDFVRGGAASSACLTENQIKRLSDDKSHTTLCYLARNPCVPEKYLLKLYYEKKMGLSWFAMNPKCPEILERKMQEQGDKVSLQELENSRKSKTEDRYYK